MYERVDLFPIVARSVVCMHLDTVQVVHRMAARKCKSCPSHVCKKVKVVHHMSARKCKLFKSHGCEKVKVVHHMAARK